MSEQFIYALSTKSELKVEQFNEIFQRIYTPSKAYVEEDLNVDARRQVIRILDSLGYCEFDYDSRKISMCPPSLVLLPGSGLSRALLVGSRTPRLIQKLKEAVKKRSDSASTHTTPQDKTHVNIPASIQIEAIDIETIREVGREAGIRVFLECPAAWKLTHFSASVGEIEKRLKFETRYEPNWKRRVFIPEKVSFSTHAEENQSDFRLVEYKNPVTQQLQHWLWNGLSAADTGRDWGRYIVLAHCKFSVLLYDERLQRMAVPSSVPLPCLLARVLALCSGRIPMLVRMAKKSVSAIDSNYSAHIYLDIPPEVAALTAAKLGQNLIMTDLDSAIERDS